MEDEPVGKEGPILLANEFHQHRLDFFRIGLAGKAKAGGEARDVGVDHDADVDVVRVAEDDIGGFASNARELHERVHGGGDFPIVVLDEKAAAGADVFGLVAVKADGPEVVLKGGRIGVGIVAGGAIFFKERRSDLVDLNVRALRRKDGGDEKLERAGEIEFAVRTGIDLGQNGAERFRAFSGGGSFHSRD